MLPMDYQYYLSAWIYKVLFNADKDFAQFLHQTGYSGSSKNFKLFNYSPLIFEQYVLWKERALFEIKGDSIKVKVSFQLGEAAEKFIIGLFNQQIAYIGNKFNGIELRVNHIERIPDLSESEKHLYRALSPVVISVIDPSTNYAKYISPKDKDYSKWIKNNLINKYNSIPDNANKIVDYEMDFVLKNEPRSKLITIKPDSEQASKIRGYLLDFELTAPHFIHNLIQSAGFGEKNSMGFGWCEENNN
jgi:CRISPR-associated endoribonuclease Cas6